MGNVIAKKMASMLILCLNNYLPQLRIILHFLVEIEKYFEHFQHINGDYEIIERMTFL